MTKTSTGPAPSRAEHAVAVALLLLCLGFNLWAGRVGWESRHLPGVEFRQAQTAISAYYIQAERNFSLDYPTPVLGKPWSIPLEFPLYQWTAVVVSDLGRMNLTQAGRAVSMACFYLTLPAVLLLLGRLGVAVGRRWWVLAMVLTSPLYIFYSRAFLIETMALMFGVWFWLSFERAVEERSRGWLIVAIIAGSGAGLVKVTTLIVYLMPVAWWAGKRLWLAWRDRATRWRGDVVWMALAVAVPFGVSLWWIRHSEATRALNPNAQFLLSGNLSEFILGSWTARMSPELWRQQWTIVAGQLSWAPLFAGGAALALGGAKSRRCDVLLLVGCFASPLFIFPGLYAVHEYYFVANAVVLMMALGLVLVGLAESARPLWLVTLAAVALAGGQVFGYLDRYYDAQRHFSPGGDGLTRSLQAMTRPPEVLVVLGQDWNSMTPYYAQRRALMVRADVEANPDRLDAAFASLAGEKVGALVVPDQMVDRAAVVQRAVAAGIDPAPIYRWRGWSVHLPVERREESIRHLRETSYDAVAWAPGVELPAEQLAGEWFEVRKLQPYQQLFFQAMSPAPLKFFSSHGLTFEVDQGVPKFGAHPETRLVYRLPAGRHRLRTAVGFSPQAYDPLELFAQRTDGVEVTLTALSSGEMQQVLFTRIVNPSDREADRGMVLVKVEFTLDQAAEVELYFGPGPANNDLKDWIWLSRLVIDRPDQ